jgi:tellurite resistance protein
MDNENPRARLYYLFGTNQHPHGSSWLARLPAGIFAISVGLFGLVGAWRRAAAFGWQIAGDVAALLIWPVVAIWVISLILYALKCKRHPESVIQEYRHPVQGSLQALIPLSVLLAVIHFNQPHQGVWLVLALVALGLHLVIALRVVSTLATGRMPTNAITPALYLPVVGGALVGAMSLAALQYPGWAAMLFGTGLSGWALLEARILSKLFEGPMPEGVRPTIGVELAPPAIATLTAAVIWPQLPAEVLMIGLGVSIAPFVGVMARYRWWCDVPFSVGFWSFSFPLAALASVILEAVNRGSWPSWIGIVALLAATSVIAFLALRTAILLLQGRFLPRQ